MYAVRSRNSSGRPSGEHSACEAQAVEHNEPEEHGCRHNDVAIERQGGRELSVEKRRESARTAAGRAGVKMEEPAPKAQVRAARQHFGGNQAERRDGQEQERESWYAAREHGLPIAAAAAAPARRSFCWWR